MELPAGAGRDQGHQVPTRHAGRYERVAAVERVVVGPSMELPAQAGNYGAARVQGPWCSRSFNGAAGVNRQKPGDRRGREGGQRASTELPVLAGRYRRRRRSPRRPACRFNGAAGRAGRYVTPLDHRLGGNMLQWSCRRAPAVTGTPRRRHTEGCRAFNGSAGERRQSPAGSTTSTRWFSILQWSCRRAPGQIRDRCTHPGFSHRRFNGAAGTYSSSVTTTPPTLRGTRNLRSTRPRCFNEAAGECGRYERGSRDAGVARHGPQ
jgi:hypothetical protein